VTGTHITRPQRMYAHHQKLETIMTASSNSFFFQIFQYFFFHVNYN